MSETKKTKQSRTVLSLSSSLMPQTTGCSWGHSLTQVIIRSLLCKQSQLILPSLKNDNSLLDTATLRPCSLLSLISSHLRLLVLDVYKQALAGVLKVEARLVEPRVSANLVEGWSVVGIVAEKRLNEVLELGA